MATCSVKIASVLKMIRSKHCVLSSMFLFGGFPSQWDLTQRPMPTVLPLGDSVDLMGELEGRQSNG